MKNKIKWLIKRILIFIKFPARSLYFFINNIDPGILHTRYENNKLIKKNYLKYQKLTLNALNVFDFKDISQKSQNSSAHLKDSINKDYFSDLNSYGYGIKLIEDSSFKEIEVLKNYYLYPANVFVLNEIKRLFDNSEIGEGLIVDYPSGLGNLLIYLEQFYEKSNLYGIDNYAQISKGDIDKYQNLMGSNFDIKTISKFKQEIIKRQTDVVVCVELNLDLIIDELLDLDSKFLIIETMYVSRYKNIINKLNQNYSIYLINESIVIYKRR